MSAIIVSIITASSISLINFISTKIYNRVTGASKNFIWRDKLLGLNNIQPPLSFEELKKRVRIVVIDDEEGFPVELFKSEGYAIDKWNRVADVGYGKLESGFYDIIVLDIKGVAEDISVDDGLGVLEGLKKTNPSQIIIAYSQHSYDLSKARFWQMADEKIAKPSDFLKMKDIVDTLIKSKFNTERYIKALHSLLEENNINKNQVQKIDTEILKMTKTKQPLNLEAKLPSNFNKELIGQIISISNTILKFFQ